MSNTATISCTLNTTNTEAALGFEVWVDNQKFFDTDHVQAQQQVVIEINDDDDSEHELRFVMKNKKPEHTQIDTDNNIIADANLIITDLLFEGITLGHIVTKQAVYTHNFNGTGQVTHDKFYKEMGCNGTVNFKFSTPIYLWLLETM
jgi:hypothetical protein